MSKIIDFFAFCGMFIAACLEELAKKFGLEDKWDTFKDWYTDSPTNRKIFWGSAFLALSLLNWLYVWYSSRPSL